MIEKMKKLTFLVYHREYEDFLHRLQDVGIMHIVTGEVDSAQSPALSGYLDQINHATQIQTEMKQLLAAAKLKPSPVVEADVEKGLVLTDNLPSRFTHWADLRQRATELDNQLAQLEPWGNFEPTDVEDKMKAAGCELQFYTAPTKVFKNQIAPEYPVAEISTQKGNTCFVLVSHGEPTELPATRVTLPNVALNKLRSEYEAVAQELKAETDSLTRQSQIDIVHVEAALSALQAKIQFNTVKEGTQTAANDHLMVLTGWFPASRQQEIEQAFKDTSVWYEISDPTPEDNIPICLKNNRFFRLFEVITNLYMLPKYNEIDLTPFFAPFYILFFGLCLGDSGYGLFITLAVLAVKAFMKNLSDTVRGALNLLLTLGISALVFGLLSGAFFGFNLYDFGVPLFDKIGSLVALDNSQMFNLSLVLGFIQIIFGMCLKATNQTIQLGFRYSLSTIGWILIILSVAAGMFLPQYAEGSRIVTFAGLALAFLYNNPDAYKKPLTGLPLNVGLGLWDAYNMATGMLGDMLSYVRLFALGLSGGILATVFNSLALGLAPENAIIGPIVIVLIFVFGHGLNIFMNVLGAFVHPMRLTFVEFFKNAGYEGGGLTYKPFRN